MTVLLSRAPPIKGLICICGFMMVDYTDILFNAVTGHPIPPANHSRTAMLRKETIGSIQAKHRRQIGTKEYYHLCKGF